MQSKAKLAKKLPGPKRELNAKQKKWFDHYAVHRNGTQASLHAGYSAKSASSNGSVMLKNRLIQKALAEYDFEKSYPKEVKKDWIIQQLHKQYEDHQKKHPSSAIKCLENLIKLSDFNPDSKKGANPNTPAKSATTSPSTSFDEMTTGDQIDVLRRTIERLAHADKQAKREAGKE